MLVVWVFGGGRIPEKVNLAAASMARLFFVDSQDAPAMLGEGTCVSRLLCDVGDEILRRG